MQELSEADVCEVSGGMTRTQVLAIGAGVTTVGAAVLVAVGSPLLAPAVAVYGIAAGGFALGAALSDAGFGGFLIHSVAK